MIRADSLITGSMFCSLDKSLAAIGVLGRVNLSMTAKLKSANSMVSAF